MRYRWDVLFDSMLETIETVRDDKREWQRMAKDFGVTKNQYLAAQLTHTAQFELDFAFKSQIDWWHVNHVLFNSLESRSKRFRRDSSEAIACDCMKYVAHAVDFMDYLDHRLQVLRNEAV